MGIRARVPDHLSLGRAIHNMKKKSVKHVQVTITLDREILIRVAFQNDVIILDFKNLFIQHW